MRRRTWIAVALCATAALALAVVGVTSAAHSTKGGGAKGKPILIGAAVDLTKNMAPFDAPALAAAQIEIKKINAAGGVLGRPLQIIPINDQLDPTKTQQAAAQATRTARENPVPTAAIGAFASGLLLGWMLGRR